jgi:hypothetical protein
MLLSSGGTFDIVDILSLLDYNVCFLTRLARDDFGYLTASMTQSLGVGPQFAEVNTLSTGGDTEGCSTVVAESLAIALTRYATYAGL